MQLKRDLGRFIESGVDLKSWVDSTLERDADKERFFGAFRRACFLTKSFVDANEFVTYADANASIASLESTITSSAKKDGRKSGLIFTPISDANVTAFSDSDFELYIVIQVAKELVKIHVTDSLIGYLANQQTTESKIDD